MTLFLVTTMFVGNLDQISRHMPELQAGLGALTRVRMMLRAEPEPVGGRPLPEGPLDLAFSGLRFAYEDGAFALHGIDLHVPANAGSARLYGFVNPLWAIRNDGK